MKILLIDGSQSPPSFVGNLMNGLLRSGVHVALLGKQHGRFFVPEIQAGFTRLVTSDSRRKLRFLFDLFFVALVSPRAFLKAIKSTFNQQKKAFRQRIFDLLTYAKVYAYDPDIIHFQWAAHAVDYEALVRTGKYKLVISLRGMHINVSPRINPGLGSRYIKLFPVIDRFHAVSKCIGEEAQKYQAPADKITVIYSMLPHRFLTFFKREQNPIRTPLTILSIGRFNWQKGYRYGIEAVYALKRKGIFATYTIVGGSEIPEEDIFLVHKLDLGDQVSFVRQIDYQQVPLLMASYSVLLLPSVAEGIANVVLEAMAVGLPVISTDAGGMSEVIVTGKTGWLVPVADPIAISEALIDFLHAKEDQLTEIRQNAHSWVSENNNSDRQTERFIDLYRAVLDQ